MASATRVSDRLIKVSVPWSSDSLGDFADTVELVGSIVRVVTVPDETDAPTDDYDITIVDVDGADVMDGALADRATATVEQVVPTVPVPVAGDHTVTIAAAGDEKAGTVIIYVAP